MRKLLELLSSFNFLLFSIAQLNSINWELLKPLEGASEIAENKDYNDYASNMLKRLLRTPNRPSSPSDYWPRNREVKLQERDISDILKGNVNTNPKALSFFSNFENPQPIYHKKEEHGYHLLPVFGFAVVDSDIKNTITSQETTPKCFDELSQGVFSTTSKIKYERSSSSKVGENSDSPLMEKSVESSVHKSARETRPDISTFRSLIDGKKSYPNFGLSVEDAKIFKPVFPWKVSCPNLTQTIGTDYWATKLLPMNVMSSQFLNNQLLERQKRFEAGKRKRALIEEGFLPPPKGRLDYKLNLDHNINLPLLNALLKQTSKNWKEDIKRQGKNLDNYSIFNFDKSLKSVNESTKKSNFEEKNETSIPFSNVIASYPSFKKDFNNAFNFEETPNIFMSRARHYLPDQSLGYPSLPLNLTIVNRIVDTNGEETEGCNPLTFSRARCQKNCQKGENEKENNSNKWLLQPKRICSSEIKKEGFCKCLDKALENNLLPSEGKVGTIIHFTLVSGVKGVEDGLYFDEELKGMNKRLLSQKHNLETGPKSNQHESLRGIKSLISIGGMSEKLEEYEESRTRSNNEKISKKPLMIKRIPKKDLAIPKVELMGSTCSNKDVIKLNKYTTEKIIEEMESSSEFEVVECLVVENSRDNYEGAEGSNSTDRTRPDKLFECIPANKKLTTSKNLPLLKPSFPSADSHFQSIPLLAKSTPPPFPLYNITNQNNGLCSSSSSAHVLKKNVIKTLTENLASTSPPIPFLFPGVTVFFHPPDVPFDAEAFFPYHFKKSTQTNISLPSILPFP